MQNTIGKFLFYAGIGVMVIGIILSLIISNFTITNEFGTESVKTDSSLIISILFGHIVIGFILIGLSEVIKLLQVLVNRQDGMKDDDLSEVQHEEKLEETVSDLVREEIGRFYASKAIQVNEIFSTDQEDFYIVTYGENKDLVELGGFSPRVIKRLK